MVSPHPFFDKLRRLWRFLLFKEDNPKHFVLKDISPFTCVITFFVAFISGILGFVALAHLNILGFVTYYVIVAVIWLELLHILCDR